MKSVKTKVYAVVFLIGKEIMRKTFVLSASPPDLEAINRDSQTKYTGMVCKEVTNPEIRDSVEKHIVKLILSHA